MAGMSVWVALVMLGIFLGITTVGDVDGREWRSMLFIIYSFLPGEFLITLFGSSRVNASSWTLVAYERVLMFDMRGNP